MSRTLFIGLDGATFTVLDQLTAPDPESGIVVMPFLKQLIEGGVRAKLRSTRNPLTPPAWVSLMTGRSPGHHGVFDFLRAEERVNDVYFTLSDSRDVRTEMIWSIATRQERSVVALNFPITAPPRRKSGTIVPGFVPWKHLRRNVAPAGTFERLKGLEGFDVKALAWDFELESKAMDALDEDELEKWVAYHLPREQQWFRIAEKLFCEDEPDLMAVMFDGTDKIQHQAWSFLVGGAVGAQEPERIQRVRGLCQRYFASVDDYIARLAALAGTDAHIFLASDHGFTGSTEVVRINTFLHDRGYLTFNATNASAAGERRQRSWFADLDWSKTLAYCRTPSSNGITIRVAGRNSEFGVRPDEYAAFRKRLIADLRDLRAADGSPIITDISTREDAFPGPAMNAAPDLTLTLRDFGFVSIANARPIVQQRAVVAGTHHPDGVLIGAGPGIVAGREIERRNIVDVAAILLYSLGLPIPEDLEGKVPEGLFTPAWINRRPVEAGASTLPVRGDDKSDDADIADAEKEKIIRQLQLLGYME